MLVTLGSLLGTTDMSHPMPIASPNPYKITPSYYTPPLVCHLPVSSNSLILLVFPHLRPNRVRTGLRSPGLNLTGISRQTPCPHLGVLCALWHAGEYPKIPRGFHLRSRLLERSTTRSTQGFPTAKNSTF